MHTDEHWTKRKIIAVIKCCVYQFSGVGGLVPPRYAGQLVAPNMPGYGGSTAWRADWGPLPLPTLADTLETVMGEQGENKQWRLLGHSMGGGLALAVAGLTARPIVSLAVFEPNLFSLLALGNPEERQLLRKH